MVIDGRYCPLDRLGVVEAQVLALAVDGPRAGVRTHRGGPGVCAGNRD